MTEENKIPNDDQLTLDDIEPNVDLAGADLSGAKLRNTDLSGANLSECDMYFADFSDTDFSDANLEEANIKGSNLRGAEMPDANLRRAKLSDACCENVNFQDADLFRAECFNTDFAAADFSEANLVGAILTESLLPEADFSGASIREITLDGSKLSRGTNFDKPGDEITIKKPDDDELPNRKRYDIIARTNHELKNAYSENGLVSEARKSRYRERKNAVRKHSQPVENMGNLNGSRQLSQWFSLVMVFVYGGSGY